MKKSLMGLPTTSAGRLADTRLNCVADREANTFRNLITVSNVVRESYERLVGGAHDRLTELATSFEVQFEAEKTRVSDRQ